jgi:MFS family permease
MDACQTNQHHTAMKNKTAISIILCLIGSLLAGLYGPWWAPSVFILLLCALMGLAVKQSILAGSLSLGLVYLAMALWMNSQDKAEIIEKTGMLLGGLSPVMMIVVTTLIGSITGLLSGWLGSVIGSMISKK